MDPAALTPAPRRSGLARAGGFCFDPRRPPRSPAGDLPGVRRCPLSRAVVPNAPARAGRAARPGPGARAAVPLRPRAAARGLGRLLVAAAVPVVLVRRGPVLRPV